MLLVNYWEIRPNRIGARLDELLARGISQFATFVPWQAAESDISHALTRLLQAVTERRMNVYLILSPEVGIHYPNSGLPKDVIARQENMAQDFQSKKITVNLPPNSFTLPSLFAPDFNKRYYSFLARMDSLFSDLAKTQPQLLTGVTALLSGSYWKYYRSPVASSQSVFGGHGGDYSTHAGVAYRQQVETFFSQKEFMDPTPASANRWKTRSLDETNRRWFYQHAEDVFRHRSLRMIRKKATELKVLEAELFTPEADPSLSYSNFLQMISGGHADFSRLSALIEEASSRISRVSTDSSSASASTTMSHFIHWTSMGGFRLLTEAEKQFLILKSLLLVGAQGGGILMDETEWFSLSQNFRGRADALARALTQGDLKLRYRALYLAPHLWSDYGVLWEELSRRVGAGAKVVSSLDLVLRERFSNLLIVDPTFILTRENIQKLTAWAKAGRVVVIPRSQLYTQMGRMALEQILAKTQRMEVDLGLTYSLHGLGDGKLILYDVRDQLSMKGEPLSSWQNFLNALLSIAELESYCRMSDSRLSIIPFERRKEGLAVFVLNGTRRQVSADIIFPSDVEVTDLGVALSTGMMNLTAMEKIGQKSIDVVKGGSGRDNLNKGGTPQPNRSDTAVSPANRFSLEVPPFGVLPLAVEGLNITEVRERQIAAMISEETQKSAMTAAESELPGFDNTMESIDELWN